MKQLITSSLLLLALLGVAFVTPRILMMLLTLLVVALIFTPSTIDAEEAHLSQHSKGVFGPGGQRCGMGGWRRF